MNTSPRHVCYEKIKHRIYRSNILISLLPKAFSSQCIIPTLKKRSATPTLMNKQRTADNERETEGEREIQQRSIFYSFHDKERTSAASVLAVTYVAAHVRLATYCISGLRNVITPRLEFPRILSRFPVCDLLLLLPRAKSRRVCFACIAHMYPRFITRFPLAVFLILEWTINAADQFQQ